MSTRIYLAALLLSTTIVAMPAVAEQPNPLNQVQNIDFRSTDFATTVTFNKVPCRLRQVRIDFTGLTRGSIYFHNIGRTTDTLSASGPCDGLVCQPLRTTLELQLGGRSVASNSYSNEPLTFVLEPDEEMTEHFEYSRKIVIFENDPSFLAQFEGLNGVVALDFIAAANLVTASGGGNFVFQSTSDAAARVEVTLTPKEACPARR